MNIVMFTNIYRPHVGGVTRSVASFVEVFRRRGHRVLIIAPQVNHTPLEEPDLVQVPAVQNFNGTEFSAAIPIPGLLTETLDAYHPQIVHSHHPFLLGDTALSTAAARGLPLVFTYHTMWEHYTHYLPSDSDALKAFVARIAADYANLADHVIAPTDSVAQILRERGVTQPVSAIPTGIDPAEFADGDGPALRAALRIPPDAFVVGHVGRFGPEKNLGFLAAALAEFLRRRPAAHALLVGAGPEQATIEGAFEAAKVRERLHLAGERSGPELADAYHAMDVFAFSSHSETQGMVLAEAATAGRPIVAIDAPGVREVLRDDRAGRRLPREDLPAFVAALEQLADAPSAERRRLEEEARRVARAFALEHCAARTLEIYQRLADTAPTVRDIERSAWRQAVRLLETEWKLWSGRAAAAVKSLGESIGARS